MIDVWAGVNNLVIPPLHQLLLVGLDEDAIPCSIRGTVVNRDTIDSTLLQ